MLIHDVFRFKLVELLRVDHVANVFVQKNITSHRDRAKLTFHQVLWTVEYLMSLHAESSLNEMAITEFARLIFALFVFMLLNFK